MTLIGKNDFSLHAGSINTRSTALTLLIRLSNTHGPHDKLYIPVTSLQLMKLILCLHFDIIAVLVDAGLSIHVR